MKKILVFVMVILTSLSIIGCSNSNEENSNEGNTGLAIYEKSTSLRIVSEYENSTTKISGKLQTGDICEQGKVVGWKNGDNGAGSIISGIFGGNAYENYIHVAYGRIDNCILWKSVFVIENTPISISEVTEQSCSATTKESIDIAIANSKESTLSGTAKYNFEKTNSSAISFAKNTSLTSVIDVTELDVKNYKYAKAIIADVEIVKVFKVVEKLEWFQTKYVVSEEYTYFRVIEGSNLDFRLIYTVNDLY